MAPCGPSMSEPWAGRWHCSWRPCPARCRTTPRLMVVSSVAPVLIVPDVLDRATTLALIRRWHEQGNDEGRVATVIKGEKTNRLYEHLKKRRDHIIRDDAVTQVLATTIGRRVAPEMA